MTITRRNFIKSGGLAMAGMAIGDQLFANMENSNYASRRPVTDKRRFVSQAVDELIEQTQPHIKDAKLAQLFANCFPNTLDTTVWSFTEKGPDSLPDTFIITGDIHALWLRDSAAQVWPYLPLMARDARLQTLIRGLIFRQAKCICWDPYANAFNEMFDSEPQWKDDDTQMKRGLHERKWEIDSLCYPVRLAYQYWRISGDTSVFGEKIWQDSAKLVYRTFVEQQKKNGPGPYRFQRGNSIPNNGWGNPVKPVGLIASAFRPSDDQTIFQFLIPSNLFAVVTLRHLAEIHDRVIGDKKFTTQCLSLADEVAEAVKRYGIVEHEKYGRIYAYEVDGYGGCVCMDDANVPSLLGLPYLGCCDREDQLYQNTRKFVLSLDNPYFYVGKAAEGMGGPHIGPDYIWPMSIVMRAMTSIDDVEIARCVQMLRDTDADTGLMHESFHKDDPHKFTRSWFAWANTLFGELIFEQVQQGKGSLLAG